MLTHQMYRHSKHTWHISTQIKANIGLLHTVACIYSLVAQVFRIMKLQERYVHDDRMVSISH